MGQRGPHFLTVDYPLIALFHGGRFQAGKIGTGAGLGITNRNQAFTRQDFGNDIGLLPFVAVLGQLGPDRFGREEGEGIAGAHNLFHKNKLLNRAHAATAKLLGPAHTNPAVTTHFQQRFAPQRATALTHIPIALDSQLGRHQLVEIGPQLGAQGFLFRRKFDFHYSSS